MATKMKLKIHLVYSARSLRLISKYSVIIWDFTFDILIVPKPKA